MFKPFMETILASALAGSVNEGLTDPFFHVMPHEVTIVELTAQGSDEIVVSYQIAKEFPLLFTGPYPEADYLAAIAGAAQFLVDQFGARLQEQIDGGFLPANFADGLAVSGVSVSVPSIDAPPPPEVLTWTLDLTFEFLDAEAASTFMDLWNGDSMPYLSAVLQRSISRVLNERLSGSETPAFIYPEAVLINTATQPTAPQVELSVSVGLLILDGMDAAVASAAVEDAIQYLDEERNPPSLIGIFDEELLFEVVTLMNLPQDALTITVTNIVLGDVVTTTTTTTHTTSTTVPIFEVKITGRFVMEVGDPAVFLAQWENPGQRGTVMGLLIAGLLGATNRPSVAPEFHILPSECSITDVAQNTTRRLRQLTGTGGGLTIEFEITTTQQGQVPDYADLIENGGEALLASFNSALAAAVASGDVDASIAASLEGTGVTIIDVTQQNTQTNGGTTSTTLTITRAPRGRAGKQSAALSFIIGMVGLCWAML